MKTDKQCNTLTAVILTTKIREWEREGLKPERLSPEVIGFGVAMFRYGFITRELLFESLKGYLEQMGE